MRDMLILTVLGFMPTELTHHREEGFVFSEAPVEDILVGRYDELDPDCVNLLKNSIDRMPWRLYIHQPYTVSNSLPPPWNIRHSLTFPLPSRGSRGRRAFWGTLLTP